ncbi:hypothetical protein [Winogradskyella sp. SYSU M77433]|uniref:hypothetical protein n=1 Tax=Winogradskyella sp. SYSU M77433 TaxID=3042722 RepID=UPI00247FB670|nr:hypothetical protein [Winogradskyella sp. SYSU M77433]MDH7912474.1 hypothetical protein [Winogradskyella sp. SYSU M77433]
MSCEIIIECIFNKSPEIPDKEFVVGNIGYYYFDEIVSEIKNDPRDDDYDYFYEFIGDLPEGLDFYTDYRTLTIEGTPQESGVFEFTLYLEVDPPEHYDEESGEYEDSMCSTSTSKDFSITIQ